MQKIFRNILILVTRDIKTDRLVEKAIEFANQLECHLHLLFIIKTPFFSFLNKQKKETEKKIKVLKLKEKNRERLIKGLKLFICFQRNDIENRILKYCEANEIDMIVACGELKRPGFFASNIKAGKLAGSINYPVLTIKSYPDVQQLKTIVLPIGGFLPINHIRVAIYLGNHFNASIHLVGLEKNGGLNEDLEYIKRAFRILKNNTELPVVFNTISGNDLADAAVQYANSVNAGLVMMNPVSESVIPGFVNRLFSKFVNKKSKVPVITVA
jgi:hypothetical protein